MTERARFLAHLESELAKALPPAEAAALTAEARAHVEESIQARLELGRAPEEAEREAIQAFGTIRATTHEANRTARLPRERLRRRCLTASYAILTLIALTASLAEEPSLLDAGLFLALFGAHAAFSAASFGVRRPAPLRVGLTSLGLGLGVWLVVVTIWVAPKGGFAGPYRRSAVAATAERYRAEATRWQGLRRRIVADLASLQSARGLDALRVRLADGRTGYRTLDVDYRRIADGQEPLFMAKYVLVFDRVEARQGWAMNGANLPDPGKLRREAAGLERAACDPWESLGSLTDVPLFSPAGLLALPVGLDLGFGSLGALAFAFRRRIQGGKAVA